MYLYVKSKIIKLLEQNVEKIFVILDQAKFLKYDTESIIPKI